VDGFLEKPDAVRARALACRFVESFGAYTGSSSQPGDFDVGPIAAAVARTLGADIAYERDGPCFRTLTRKQDARPHPIVHFDDALWTAIVCLTPPSSRPVFLRFYRHRATGLLGVHDGARVQQALRAHRLSFEELGRRLRADSRELSRWDEMGSVAHLYNRLIVLRSRDFHAAAAGVGSSLRTAKLTFQIPFEIVGDEQQLKTRSAVVRTSVHRPARRSAA
jgi:hypothetical protein